MREFVSVIFLATLVLFLQVLSIPFFVCKGFLRNLKRKKEAIIKRLEQDICYHKEELEIQREITKLYRKLYEKKSHKKGYWYWYWKFKKKCGMIW